MYDLLSFSMSMNFENKDFRKLFEIYKITDKMARKMIILDVDQEDFEDFSEIDYHQTEELFNNFLKSLGGELADNYLNVMNFNPQKIHFVSVHEEQRKSDIFKQTILKRVELGQITEDEAEELINQLSEKQNRGSIVDEKGNLIIFLEGNIKDLFMIIHELTHMIYFQNFPANNRPQNFNFLVEINAVTMELLLYEYLFKNNLYQEDACKFINNRFNEFISYIYVFLFDMLLFRIVEKHGRLSSRLIDKYIAQEEEKLQIYFKYFKGSYLEEIPLKGFSFATLNRYIIAILCGCHLKRKIKEDKTNLNLLFGIGRDIYSDDLYNSLQSNDLDYLDVDLRKILGIFKKEVFIINEEKLQGLLDEYLEEFETLQERLNTNCNLNKK